MGHDFRNKPFLLRSLPILDFMSMASKLDDYLEQAHTLTELKFSVVHCIKRHHK